MLPMLLPMLVLLAVLQDLQFLFLCNMSKTNKAGSDIFSIGLGGDTVKKTRKSKARRASGSKSLRSTADGLMVKKYSRAKGKRVSKKIAKKTTRIKKSAGGTLTLNPHPLALTHIPSATLNVPH